MVAPALYAPMTGDSWNNGIRVEGQPEPEAKDDTGAGFVRAMPQFFEPWAQKSFWVDQLRRRTQRQRERWP